jgi:hypothetical protein
MERVTDNGDPFLLIPLQLITNKLNNPVSTHVEPNAIHNIVVVTVNQLKPALIVNAVLAPTALNSTPPSFLCPISGFII